MTVEHWHGPAYVNEPAVRISYVKAGALDWPGYAYIGNGRWDDPHGHFRVLYFGSSAVAAYLEVLAHYRAAPGLDAELDDIVVDEIDEEQAPTAGGRGLVPVSWLADHLRVEVSLTGRYLDVGHPVTLASLHRQFGAYAISQGLAAGVDLSAITSGSREFTQHVSGQLFGKLHFSTDPSSLDGIEYPSRHGHNLRLWALYERAERGLGDRVRLDVSSECVATDPDLEQAMDIHGLRWET